MKRIILFTVFALVGIVSLQAQSTEPEPAKVYKNQLLIAPFHLFDATFMLSYERLFPLNNTNTELRITPSVMLSNIDQDDYSFWGEEEPSYNREGFGIDVGYKIFLFDSSRKINIYAGPYALYKYIRHNYTEEPDGTINAIGFGVDTGVQICFGRFVMDATLGGGMRYPMFDGSDTYSAESIFDDRYKGITPRVNFVLGLML